jgi:hypothetical protein
MNLYDLVSGGRIVTILLFVACVAYTISLIAWGYLYAPVDGSGVVSSVMTVCNPFYCTDKIEFYGGQADIVFKDERFRNVSAGQICRVISHGMWLDSITCEVRA